MILDVRAIDVLGPFVTESCETSDSPPHVIHKTKTSLIRHLMATLRCGQCEGKGQGYGQLPFLYVSLLKLCSKSPGVLKKILTSVNLPDGHRLGRTQYICRSPSWNL